MVDEGSKAVAGGELGRLPAWPRKPLNNSAIAAEQAYRKRSGLPLIGDEDIEALKAGQPMSWEGGEAAPAAPAPSVPAAAAPAPPPAPAATPPAAAASATPSPAAAELMKSGFKWSKSSLAAEQARRKRNSLPPLTDSDLALLLGEAPPAAPAAAPAAAAPARPAAAVAAKPAPAMPAVSQVARTGSAVKFVGTPAVGTSKAAAAGGVSSGGRIGTEIDAKRRRLVWTGVVAFLAVWLLAFFRFFLPRTLFEPSTVFKIGYPSDFGLGVDTKFQQRYRIWVDRIPGRLFVIFAKCTHLGCTPDWKPSENKFKCPCHGSGYDSEGINFEGPAPRPMDRAHVEIAPDGQVLVDASRLYQWPKGQASHFDDPGAFLSV
ncbi:MAG: Rieske 2Fe-2S domain-containing protein [Acidobacteriia bacterium]|nr:Rieske 2Fe-2S domain-containing protein [Terriglobia bacterium]